MTDKSVAEKAHVRPDDTIGVINRVPGVVESLGLPAKVTFVAPEAARLVFLFANTRAELDALMPDTAALLTEGTVLWVFFRKGSRAAGLDMSRNDVWSIAEQQGLRPLGLLSVDESWSVFRLKR